MFIHNFLKSSAPVCVSVLILSALVSCGVSDKPQAMNLGKDKCTACSMTIEEEKVC